MPLNDDSDKRADLPELPDVDRFGSAPSAKPAAAAPSSPSPAIDALPRLSREEPSDDDDEDDDDDSRPKRAMKSVDLGLDSPAKAQPAVAASTADDESRPQRAMKQIDLGLDSPPKAQPAIVAPTGGKPPSPHDSPTSSAPVADSSDPYLGRTFGGYQLVARIGAGGMGVVYKGRQVSLDREVAVKILNKALVDNDEFILRFEREAKSIARISHPNIVAVYDFGQSDGIYYMVTEFVEGTNLAKLIGDKLMLSIEEMLPLVTHCLGGLHHVSASGIIHRDIKPDNILVTTDKQAKIADFGLAKNVTDDKTDLTAVGLAMGTPAYMSPEQCMGRRLDVRSDIYALGVTAYFALTGEKPFVGQSSFEIMTKQREFTPPPPVQLNPRIPKEASALIMRMLAKNPIDRFRDAEDCRLQWIDLGMRLGILEGVRRSGEFKFEPPKNGASPRASGEMPAMSVPAASGMLPPIMVPQQPSSAQPAPAPAPRSPAGQLPPPSLPAAHAEAPAGVSTERREHGSDAHRMSKDRTTERRAPRTSGITEQPSTCAKCGMLNRGGIDACQRCNAPLREVVFVAKEQEDKAERLLADGSFVEAAKIFGRLADKETDRRLRTIYRSKEREAKSRAQDGQLAAIEARGKTLTDQGDLKGGLEMLERGLKEMREAGTSAGDAEARLLQAIDTLRRRLSSRRRTRLIVAMLVCAALAGGVVIAWHFGYIHLPTQRAGVQQ